MHIRLVLLAIGSVLLSSPWTLGARQCPTAASVSRTLRAEVEAGNTLAFSHVLPALVQLCVPAPLEDVGDLDALADTVVAIALEHAERDLASGTIRQAINVLGASGEWSHPRRGTRYTGAVPRLARIASEAPRVSALALGRMIAQPEREAVIGYLAEFAELDSPAANIAVIYLANRVGPEGVEVLRSLFERGAVQEPRAVRRVDAIARVEGWNPRAQGPGARRE